VAGTLKVLSLVASILRKVLDLRNIIYLWKKKMIATFLQFAQNY
jgi:hypothetical protein